MLSQDLHEDHSYRLSISGRGWMVDFLTLHHPSIIQVLVLHLVMVGGGFITTLTRKSEGDV